MSKHKTCICLSISLLSKDNCHRLWTLFHPLWMCTVYNFQVEPSEVVLFRVQILNNYTVKHIKAI